MAEPVTVGSNTRCFEQSPVGSSKGQSSLACPFWVSRVLLPAVPRKALLMQKVKGILVGASFGLSSLTQTRYDYNATKVQAVSHEEQLQLQHDRKKIDLREEYFRLTSGADSSTASAPKRKDLGKDWDGEQKRVPRPPGMEEWGAVPLDQRSKEVGTRLV